MKKGDEFKGTVVAVVDGDTLDIQVDAKKVRVRLQGVDAPELRQPFGYASAVQLRIFSLGHLATVRVVDVDRYGRVVGTVEGRIAGDLSIRMVRAGMAWWYKKYAPTAIFIAKEEHLAREANNGLWAQKIPVAPWVYRRRISGQPIPLNNMVRRTRTGKKYHRIGCRCLRITHISIKKRTARTWGLTSCEICRP